MFFRKKDNTDMEILNSIKNISDKIDGLNETVIGNRKSIRNNSDTISDFIDELQEKNNESEALEAQISELKKSRENLLDIIASYSEQLDMFLGGVNEENHISWERQLSIAKAQIEDSYKLCGLQKTGEPGEKSDYRIHEIIDTVETLDRDKTETVATVYSQGIIFNGKVIRKAKVAVYNGSVRESN